MTSEIPAAIDAEAAARHLGLSKSTLAKLRLSGNGPVYCKLGRRIVYRLIDLDAWLQSCRRRSTSEPGGDE